MDASIMIFSGLLIIIALIIIIITKNEPVINIDKMQTYKKKPILSQNEKNNYEYLKPIIERLNLNVFSKVRLLDIVECVNDNQMNFSQITSKHIDFVVCNSKLDVICCIELDDKSEKFLINQDNEEIKNKEIKNQILKISKIPLIRSYNFKTSNIESQIKKYL